MKVYKLALLISMCTASALAQTTFTCVAGETENDPRSAYEKALLKLALDKTVEKYGPYTLGQSKLGSNQKRNEQDAIDNVYPNLFVKLSYSERLTEELAYIPIPADRGIVGYRVCFTSEKIKQELSEVETLEQLKEFKMLQGIGWSDVEILKAAGFRVITGTNYKGMFKMVAVNRVDLFPRGANELLGEWELNKNVAGLTYDESVALYYPLPRFFFTNKKNTEALKRVQEGLEMAFKDGSFQKLWEQYYQDSVDMIALDKRKIFRIKNPDVANLDTAYEKYNYDPEAEKEEHEETEPEE
ncbi:MAG: hypothetical protein JXR40_12930 [Pontiellaceae bacterium]|nr:hypothetical protein [Pontiellaceae bacterium]